MPMDKAGLSFAGQPRRLARQSFAVLNQTTVRLGSIRQDVFGIGWASRLEAGDWRREWVWAGDGPDVFLVAGGAEPAALAGEGQKVVKVAVVTADAGEAVHVAGVGVEQDGFAQLHLGRLLVGGIRCRRS